MKKSIKILSLILFLLCLSGCLKEDKLVSNNVYTTIYPIEYLTNYLYGTEKNVSSIYPHGANVNTYKLTTKQKETYELGALFVYNGLTSEKELAKEFLNANKDLLLIDVAYGLNYDYAIEELWLTPNNYLMLAKNIKNNLIDYATSKTVVDKIEEKYQELEEKLSYLDAELRVIASTALESGNRTIVVSSDKLKFLEKYGFEVISLDDENLNEAGIKNNYKNEKYKDIYLCDSDNKTELISQLESTYKAKIINVKMMHTLSGEDSDKKENYLTIMEEFIENIRSTALS